MKRQSVLLQPENEQYFHWDGRSLSLQPDAPMEVVRAWQAMASGKSKGRRVRKGISRLLRLLPVEDNQQP